MTLPERPALASRPARRTSFVFKSSQYGGSPKSREGKAKLSYEQIQLHRRGSLERTEFRAGFISLASPHPAPARDRQISKRSSKSSVEIPPPQSPYPSSILHGESDSFHSSASYTDHCLNALSLTEVIDAGSPSASVIDPFGLGDSIAIDDDSIESWGDVVLQYYTGLSPSSSIHKMKRSVGDEVGKEDCQIYHEKEPPSLDESVQDK